MMTTTGATDSRWVKEPNRGDSRSKNDVVKTGSIGVSVRGGERVTNSATRQALSPSILEGHHKLPRSFVSTSQDF